MVFLYFTFFLLKKKNIKKLRPPHQIAPPDIDRSSNFIKTLSLAGFFSRRPSICRCVFTTQIVIMALIII